MRASRSTRVRRDPVRSDRFVLERCKVESQSVELSARSIDPNSGNRQPDRRAECRTERDMSGGLTAGSLGKRTKTQAAKLMKNNLGSYLT